MLPTLMGRIQTRIFATLVVGGLWAVLISPALPGMGSLGDRYKAMYGVLLIVGVLGIGWELLYHGLQQFRWEKDWPTLFGLATIVNEGVVTYLVARSGVLAATEGIPLPAFLVGFVTTWLVIWLFLNGPMRIFSVHWRFNGGRLV